MTNNSIVNLGGFAKPVTRMIEKISEGIGGLYRPYQVIRVAKAEAQAAIITAAAGIKIKEIERRALERSIAEETMKQKNMDNVILKSLDQLREDSRPDLIEKDWIVNFLDRARLISDDEMQEIWARILAGEGNAPGTFSKRTVNQLASMDRGDALDFSKICNFIWSNNSRNLVIILNWDDKIYESAGIKYSTLAHLEAIGLISLANPLVNYTQTKQEKKEAYQYFDEVLKVEFPPGNDRVLSIGRVLLTAVGRELTNVCRGEKIPGFVEHIEEYWISEGLKVKRTIDS